jgi:putative transposase
MVSAQARREQAHFAIERGLSQRRACALLQVSRSSLGYALKMPVKNAPVMAAMRTLSGQYPRFGSRRIRVMLEREGVVVGKERCATLWAQAGLQVPKKKRRRRIAGNRPRPHVPAMRNAVWCYDFVFDARFDLHRYAVVQETIDGLVIAIEGAIVVVGLGTQLVQGHADLSGGIAAFC